MLRGYIDQTALVGSLTENSKMKCSLDVWTMYESCLLLHSLFIRNNLRDHSTTIHKFMHLQLSL